MCLTVCGDVRSRFSHACRVVICMSCAEWSTATRACGTGPFTRARCRDILPTVGLSVRGRGWLKVWTNMVDAFIERETETDRPRETDREKE